MVLDQMIRVRVSTAMKQALRAEATRLHVRETDLVRSALADTLDETKGIKSVATAIKALTADRGDTDQGLDEIRTALKSIIGS